MTAIPTSSFEPDFGAAMPCPYLGLRDDPVTHFAWENPEHHCHRVDPPQPIRIAHQQGYCLSGRFETCAVRNDLNPSPNPSKYRSVFEGNAPVWARLPRISLPKFEKETVPAAPFGLGETGGKRRIWVMALVGLFIPLMIVFVWAIVINAGGDRNLNATTSSTNRPSQVVPAAVASFDTPTATQPQPTATQSPSSTPTATTQPTSTSTPIADLAATQTMLAFTLARTATPTQPLYGCDDSRAYTYSILDGPTLSPEPGYVYTAGEAPPVVTASWLLENTGSCEWNSILLLSVTSGRMLVPILFIDDQQITPDPTGGSVIAFPGEQIQVTLSFSPEIASSIRGEWIAVVDDFRLTDETHLMLDVVNWIVRIFPTPTTRQVTKPGISPTQAPGISPSPTTPSTRPTPTEPSIRP